MFVFYIINTEYQSTATGIMLNINEVSITQIGLSGTFFEIVFCAIINIMIKGIKNTNR